MRGWMAGAVALVAAAAVLLGLVGVVTTGAPGAPPDAPAGEPRAERTQEATPARDRHAVLPAHERALLREAERQAEQRLLRERLGGLAALADDKLMSEHAACLPAAIDLRDEPATPAGIAQATEALRGLEFGEEVPTTELLPPTEMTARVEEAFASRADPEALAVEREILLALGAVTPDVDLRRVRLEAFAEQVSGLYSGARGEVLVRVADPERLSPLERVVLAHEYEHALTHERLGRPSQAREGAEDADQRRASMAVIEGSATLAMLQYAHAALDERERAELRRELLTRAREGSLEDFTPYLVRELQYPYTEGLVLACSRYAAGEWEAVDALYAAPPDSSLAVLLPERFTAGSEPSPPPVLNRPGGGWRQVAADAFGAADLLWLLEAPGADPDAALPAARDRVAAWQGGRLVAWSDGGSTVVGLSLAQRDGEESLCATMLAWQEAGWDARSTRLGAEEAGAAATRATHVFEEPERVVAISCDAAGVRVAVAGDRAHALAVVAAEEEISSILGMTGHRDGGMLIQHRLTGLSW